jgi:hypothetical protein
MKHKMSALFYQISIKGMLKLNRPVPGDLLL